MEQNPELQLGSMVGQYRVLGMLGRGTWGCAFRCWDEAEGGEWTLRTLPTDLAVNPGGLEAMSEGTRAASSLSHENITVFKEICLSSDRRVFYLVREYLEGEALHRLARPRTVAPNTKEALAVLRPAARALDFAHGRCILHLGFTRGNVLLGKGGNVKVSDFGISERIWKGFTQLHAGDPEWNRGPDTSMAPECLRGEEPRRQTDQFSLARLACELLIGSAPRFDCKIAGPSSIAWPGSVPQRPTGLSDATWAVLSRGLCEHPRERFPSCRDFVEAIARAA